MVISRTPFRISFFGGGTDYPAWYRVEGGAVLSTTIDKYCYISCRYLPPFFNIRHRIVWSHIETISTIAEILHPAVRAGLAFMGFTDATGIELHHQGDLPARSGIGSSSSFAVGLLNVLSKLQGLRWGQHQLALKSIELEQDVLKESVGCQDQIAAAYGGLNVIRFEQGADIHVEPLGIAPMRSEELQSSLLLFYTGLSRHASSIAGSVIANLHDRRTILTEMKGMVAEASSILRGGSNLDEFGRLLHHAWQLKKQTAAGVSTPSIDTLYESALRSGALGGKLLGAGGSGFMLFYVPCGRQEQVIAALAPCLHVPFRFESGGSTIIYEETSGVMSAV